VTLAPLKVHRRQPIGAAASGQAVDRGTPLREYERRPEQEYFADMIKEIIFSNHHFSGGLGPPPLPELQRFTRLILAHRHP